MPMPPHRGHSCQNHHAGGHQRSARPPDRGRCEGEGSVKVSGLLLCRLNKLLHLRQSGCAAQRSCYSGLTLASVTQAMN